MARNSEELNNRDQKLPQLNAKIQNLESHCFSLESQLAASLQEKKSFQKKNEMIM